MKVLTLETPGRFVFGDAPQPSRAEPETALVRVHRVGVCGTDLHAFSGKQPFFTYPRILGHELAVEIVELGAGETSLKAGDKCSVEPYVNCGTCIACRRGKPNCCARMSVIGVHRDGGMREFFNVPLRKLHNANDLSLDQIALVETLAIGAHAVARAAIEQGENVLVIGAGPIGLSVIQFARGTGRMIVMDIDAGRLAFCRDKVGIADAVQLDPANPARTLEEIKALTAGDMPTVVFDATGSAGSMNSALQYLANGGRLVYVGLHQGDITLKDTEFHRRETTLLASRNALPEDFRQIIRSIMEKRIDTGLWITHRASLQEAASVFPDWTRPATGVLKAMITV